MTRKARQPKRVWIKFRVDEQERASLIAKAAASGRSLSTLIREALIRVKPWSVADKKTEREKIRQIARIGANLNQIAHWANRFQASADAIEVIAHLIVIEHLLTALMTKSDQDNGVVDQERPC